MIRRTGGTKLPDGCLALDVEDIAAEIALRLWPRWGELCSFRDAYIVRAAKRDALDMLRHERRRVLGLVGGADDTLTVVPFVDDTLHVPDVPQPAGKLDGGSLTCRRSDTATAGDPRRDDPTAEAADGFRWWAALRERQRSVLLAFAAGAAFPMIAAQLGRDVRTVRRIIAALYGRPAPRRKTSKQHGGTSMLLPVRRPARRQAARVGRNGRKGKAYYITQARSRLKPSPAAIAAEAGVRWPCALCEGRSGHVGCALCHGAGRFDPGRLVATQRLVRYGRECTRDDAAAQLGVAPRRLSEVLDGTDLDPANPRIGPAQRRRAAETFVRLLGALAG